jgi:5-methylcytosine-specific restriction endonuclease McrA
MNAPVGNIISTADLSACQHWSKDLPYRAVVAVSIQPAHGTILYQVAGESKAPQSAFNALKLAITKHGGKCFYCKTASAEQPSVLDFTIDHIEALAIGGTNDLTNLVVACKPCNQKKGQSTIDAFNPSATQEWLTALQSQIEGRLKKLSA